MRKNILRPWLFMEVTPVVNFPLDELTGKREAIGSIQLMFEVQIAAK